MVRLALVKQPKYNAILRHRGRVAYLKNYGKKIHFTKMPHHDCGTNVSLYVAAGYGRTI